MKVKNEREVAQSCLTLWDPMNCSLPGSSVNGIFQARVLEWGAIAFSICITTCLLFLDTIHIAHCHHSLLHYISLKMLFSDYKIDKEILRCLKMFYLLYFDIYYFGRKIWGPVKFWSFCFLNWVFLEIHLLLHTYCYCCWVTSVVSDSVWPHRWQPTRLPRPWDSPGKNTGVGCHFLLQCMKVKSESEVAQSCPKLSDPMDCSPPGSSVHGIFQARVLEWGAIAFSMHTYIYV